MELDCVLSLFAPDSVRSVFVCGLVGWLTHAYRETKQALNTKSLNLLTFCAHTHISAHCVEYSSRATMLLHACIRMPKSAQGFEKALYVNIKII